jgi:hypothetical protein
MEFKLHRTMDQVSWLGLGLYFHSAMSVTTSVLFYAPWASLISFSIPTLAAGAGTIPSRAGYIQSMLNTLISPHMIPLELQHQWHMLLGSNALAY